MTLQHQTGTKPRSIG